jgi:CubicO group peptidase (beta-lactamase class C family)
MGGLDLVSGWPVGSAAVGVLASASPDGGPVTVLGTTGDVDRSFPWASVTKPVTALAVLVAVEEGTLDLDAPGGPPGSTVRHLLAHASGLGFEGGVVDRPGARRLYSNAGFGVLGDVLAGAAGMSFTDYLHDGVLEPLGMRRVELRSDDGAPEAAAGLYGPLGDLMAVARELAAPTLVSGDTAALARSVAFPGLAGVLPGFGRFDPCDWGLGVEVRGGKSPHWTGRANSPQTFGHFGRSGSFLWVDPVAGLACCGLADRLFGPWAAAAWPALADALVAEALGSPG